MLHSLQFSVFLRLFVCFIAAKKRAQCKRVQTIILILPPDKRAWSDGTDILLYNLMMMFADCAGAGRPKPQALRVKALKNEDVPQAHLSAAATPTHQVNHPVTCNFSND